MNDEKPLFDASKDSVENPLIKDYSLKKPKIRAELPLSTLKVSELLALRAEIDSYLPPINLKSFNAQEEMLLQYHRAKELQEEIADDDEIPTNQKAQVANSVNSILTKIVSMRGQVYNDEQARYMEACLAKTLKGMTPEVQAAFYDLYQKTAEEMADVRSGATP